MFYSQFILAKKGPLGTIWIAAHLERKLRKNQVADTDIGVSVDSILSPDVPIALRLSSHLLLGVVRIYNKKVNYLFDDCSEALLKIKQAFRSTAVDLPPEESKAPYHSITLPETFDLDDFELPDSDIFQGNYVDHHISLKEQITLHDTMEGVSYSTSKFGLDERFGDGDASGLDLDEELFFDKVGTEVLADKSADPGNSFGPMFPLKHDEQPEGRGASSETRVDDIDVVVGPMDYAQAPCTPGLVEQPNLSTVCDSSACEGHLESEDHLMASAVQDIANDNYEKQIVQQCSRDDTFSNTVYLGLPKETGHVLDGMQIEESKPKEESPIAIDLLYEKEIIKTPDIPRQEDSPTEAVKEYNTNVLSVDETYHEHKDKGIGLEKSDFEISGLDGTGKKTLDGLLEKELVSLGIEVPDSLVVRNNREKSFHDDSVLGLDGQTGSNPRTPETQAGEENLGANNKVETKESLVPWSCNSVPERPSVTKPGCSVTTEVEFDTPVGTYDGEDKLGEASCVTGNWDQILKDTPEEHASVEDIQVSVAEANDQAHAISQNNLVDNLTGSPQSELPASENPLSVPEGHMYLNRDMEAEVSPRNLGDIADGDAGSKSAAGRKRSFTESTPTEQSLNSVESSRQVRAKRMVESVPDDDDLLSSILVGRSSVLKVKPSPLLEVTSVKRTRTMIRSGAPKRHVLMDDTMVLHGDTIRQQLTNTEDIRRVRKKAPCTIPEISMIQKQHMEDEIFRKTFFGGISADLVSLHSQVYDLSQIRVCQNNATDASFEIMTKLGLPSQDDKGPSLETGAKLNLTSCHAEHIPSLGSMPEWHSISPIVENPDMEPNEEPRNINVMAESERWANNEHFIVTGNEMAEPSMDPQLNQNTLEVHHGSVEVNITQEQNNPAKVFGPDGSNPELPLNVTDVGISQINDTAANSALNAEMEPLDFIEHASADMGVESVPDPKALEYTVELNCASVDELSFANDVVATVPCAKDDGLPDEAVANVVVCDSNSGELEYNIQAANCNISDEEQREMEFTYLSVPSVLQDGSQDNGEKTDNLEDIHPNVADAEISGFDMHDQDELNNFAGGNDTEVLNVDEDELTEIDDDYIPDDEEKQYAENSGWSSRTRAVSKFLQAAFIREAESGRTYLSMDNLLSGKSRKEASRMFFETLVLKTRDYIHVEQRNPFNDIAMKPRTRLMKSDF